jgi:hypothetical protein
MRQRFTRDGFVRAHSGGLNLPLRGVTGDCMSILSSYVLLEELNAYDHQAVLGHDFEPAHFRTH